MAVGSPIEVWFSVCFLFFYIYFNLVLKWFLRDRDKCTIIGSCLGKRNHFSDFWVCLFVLWVVSVRAVSVYKWECMSGLAHDTVQWRHELCCRASVASYWWSPDKQFKKGLIGNRNTSSGNCWANQSDVQTSNSWRLNSRKHALSCRCFCKLQQTFAHNTKQVLIYSKLESVSPLIPVYLTNLFILTTLDFLQIKDTFKPFTHITAVWFL